MVINPFVIWISQLVNSQVILSTISPWLLGLVVGKIYRKPPMIYRYTNQWVSSHIHSHGHPMMGKVKKKL